MKSNKYLGRVILIHGVKAKKSNRAKLRRLAPAFRSAGFCVITPSYGFIPAFMVGVFQWIDNRIAENMSAFIREDDILLGHSNGATLAYLIAKKRKVRGVILLNAALESEKVPNADWIHVYFNRGDWVARLSQLVPFHPWGSMGYEGYLGKDVRVLNIDQANPPDPALPRLDGHSAIFELRKTRPWSKYMAKLAAMYVETHFIKENLQ